MRNMLVIRFAKLSPGFAKDGILRKRREPTRGRNLHMVNITQEQPSIEKCRGLSSNRVQSHHWCEANKYQISKPFFVLFFQLQASGRYYQIKL